jgi:hypothetical protein
LTLHLHSIRRLVSFHFFPYSNFTLWSCVTSFYNLPFTDTAEINYIDILKDKWYYLDAAKATKAGYMQGYDGKLFPLDPISRQAFATVLARLTGGEAAVDDTVINNLTDGKSIPEWSKAAISTTISKGYFNGLISDAFKPEEKITRLEAVVALDRAFKSMYRAVYSKSGTYGPASGMMALDGNVAIISPDVTLKNTTINGDLILRESIGDGNVCLENVVVKGTTIVRGGGENSIVIRNSSLGRVIVRREGNVVRIVATGSTTIGEAELQSGAILEEEFLTGEGFGDIVIPDDIFAGATIVFEGNFDNVTVDSGNININMANGAIGNLTLAQGAEGTTVNLAQQASVGTLNINAAVNITGQGSIQNANVNVSGSTIQQQPQNVVKAPGVTVNIDTPEPPPAPRTGGGGGSGRSSGDDDDDNKTAVVINAINNMFVTIGHKKNISINCTPADAKISSISGNPGVAKVTVEGNTLEVEGVSVGAATITVTAERLGYYSTSRRFTVTVDTAGTIVTEDFGLLGNGKATAGARLEDGKTMSDVTAINVEWFDYDGISIGKGYLNVAYFISQLGGEQTKFSMPFGYSRDWYASDGYWDVEGAMKGEPFTVKFTVTFKNGITASAENERFDDYITVSTGDELLEALSDDKIDAILLDENILLTETLVVGREVIINGTGHSIDKAINIKGNNVVIKNLVGTAADRASHKLPGIGGAVGFYVNGRGIVLDNVSADGAAVTDATSRAVIGHTGSEFIVMNSRFSNVTTGIFAHSGYSQPDAKQVTLIAESNTFTNVLSGIGGTQKTNFTAFDNTFVSVKTDGEGIGLGTGVVILGEYTGYDAEYLEAQNTFMHSDGNKVKDYREVFFIENADGLKHAAMNQEEGQVWVVENGEYKLSEQLNITKSIHILGKEDVTIIPEDIEWSKENGYKHLIAIYAGTQEAPVRINNITVDANNISHAVSTYSNAYGALTNVTVKNGKGAGLIVNGSTIVATNLNTSGNAWGAVNVDPGVGVKTPSVFILNSGTLEEETQIWSDGSNVSEIATVEVTADGYNEFILQGTNVKIWSNKPLVNVPSITKDGATKYYPTIQAVINAAVTGDTIDVAAGIYDIGKEQLLIAKGITLKGIGETKPVIRGTAYDVGSYTEPMLKTTANNTAGQETLIENLSFEWSLKMDSYLVETEMQLCLQVIMLL